MNDAASFAVKMCPEVVSIYDPSPPAITLGGRYRTDRDEHPKREEYSSPRISQLLDQCCDARKAKVLWIALGERLQVSVKDHYTSE
jgi:hypothetical protein